MRGTLVKKLSKRSTQTGIESSEVKARGSTTPPKFLFKKSSNL